MKTEWHRYNLKRRVAHLGPVSNDTFLVKVAHSKERVQYDDFGFIIEDPALKMKKLNKRKGNSLRYELLNRGRRTASAETDAIYNSREASPAGSVHSEISLGTLKSRSEYGYDSDDVRSEISATTKDDTDYNTELESEDDFTDGELATEEEQEPLNLTICPYCGDDCQTLDDNIAHMLTNHGLYIPELGYLEDKEGLIRLLSDGVTIEKECLKCGFHSNKLIGIRQHISAKGHACIPYETKEEKAYFRRFYNFDERQIEEQEDGDVGDSYMEMDDGHEEGAESEDSEEYTIATVDSTGVELSLPNGYKLGHRSMSRYYRQSAPRDSRRLSEGEMTVSVLQNENQRLVKLQETIEHNKRNKEISLIHSKLVNKELSDKGLKYRNKFLNYRNQKLG